MNNESQKESNSFKSMSNGKKILVFFIVFLFSYFISTLLMDKKANVTIRNFSETVENIRKKWKIKEGGNLYSFFTTDENDDKIVLLCSKLK